MLFAAIVLFVSTGLFFFYLQSTCERVLRQQFDQEYFQAIARVCRLEFPSLRLAMERRDTSVDYTSACAKLQVDFAVLSSLRSANSLDDQSYLVERLLGIYFRGILFLLPVLRVAGTGKRAIKKLTAILQYFSNAAGKELCSAQLAKPLTPSEYLAGL